MDPLRATDELGDVAPRPGQRLGNLHAAGAAADDAPPLAGIGHAVVPARRVERRAGETVAPGDIRKQRPVEKTGRADENIGDIGVALGGLEVPATVGEPRRDDFLVEADEFAEAAVARDLFDVGPDLGRRRIFARPAVVRLEWKLVLARQDIDEKAGKGIVAPGPADLAGLFIDGEINARALQRLGHEQPRHARPGDDNPKSPISHHASQIELPELVMPAVWIEHTTYRLQEACNPPPGGLAGPQSCFESNGLGKNESP